VIQNLKNSTVFGLIFEEKEKNLEDSEFSEQEEEEQKISKITIKLLFLNRVVTGILRLM
jgi:hypothetical protein